MAAHEVALFTAAYAASAGLAYAARGFPAALTRASVAFPVLAFFLSIPLRFFSVSTTITGFLAFAHSWISAFKLLGLIARRGPLADPSLSFAHFAAVLLLPVYPSRRRRRQQQQQQGSAAAGSIGDSAPQSAGRRELNQLLASLAAKTAGVVALAYVSITVPLPPVLAHLTYAFYVWFFTSMMLDGPRAVLLAVLGVPGGSGGRGGGGMPQLQPSFEQPYRSHSLKEFWGVRYNKVIGSLLRDVVYEPVLQGQLVYDGARRSGSDGVDGGNAAAGAVHAGGEVVQTKQDASGAQQGERTPSDVANSNRELVSTAGAKRRQAGSSRSDGTAAVVARSVSDSSFNSNVGACVMNWAAVMSTGDSTDDSSGGGGGAALRARSVASKNDAAAKGLEQEEKQKQEEETKVNESDGGGVRRRRCAHLRARSLSAVDIVAAVSADVVDGPPSPQAARSALAATEHGSGRQDSENDNAKTASAREVVAVLGQPAAAAASAEHHRRPGSSKLRQTLATAAVFVVSGVMHEVLLVYMCGYATGKMFAFFALQAPAVMLEAQVLGAVPPAWLRRTDVQWLQVCMTWLTIMGMAEWLFWDPIVMCRLDEVGMGEARWLVERVLAAAAVVR